MKLLSCAYRLSASRILSCAQGKGAFGTAAVDVFQFTCKDIGQMQMLRIGHNNTGPSPDWHLDKVSCSWIQTAAMKFQQIRGTSDNHASLQGS